MNSGWLCSTDQPATLVLQRCFLADRPTSTTSQHYRSTITISRPGKKLTNEARAEPATDSLLTQRLLSKAEQV